MSSRSWNTNTTKPSRGKRGGYRGRGSGGPHHSSNPTSSSSASPPPVGAYDTRCAQPFLDMGVVVCRLKPSPAALATSDAPPYLLDITETLVRLGLAPARPRTTHHHHGLLRAHVQPSSADPATGGAVAVARPTSVIKDLIAPAGLHDALASQAVYVQLLAMRSPLALRVQAAAEKLHGDEGAAFLADAMRACAGTGTGTGGDGGGDPRGGTEAATGGAGAGAGGGGMMASAAEGKVAMALRAPGPAAYDSGPQPDRASSAASKKQQAKYTRADRAAAAPPRAPSPSLETRAAAPPPHPEQVSATIKNGHAVDNRDRAPSPAAASRPASPTPPSRPRSPLVLTADETDLVLALRKATAAAAAAGADPGCGAPSADTLADLIASMVGVLHHGGEGGGGGGDEMGQRVRRASNWL
ncbi:hypothetical protein H9P43_003124 [Blastocladiella emersonii ATCC 22665]|nr:hypothetical protein H9P43_003124 [Blastocladiella emersonii ATCC 22665]